MGRYYALHDKEDSVVADAIRDHYKPMGPSDAVPNTPVSIAVAIADKVHSLGAFFAVGEVPSGSSDPFALRRSALGIIRIILESRVRVNLEMCFAYPLAYVASEQVTGWLDSFKRTLEPALERLGREDVAKKIYEEEVAKSRSEETWDAKSAWFQSVLLLLMQFIKDRLKVALKERGTRHDLIDAVFSLGHEDDLVRLVARVEALQAFLKTDDGANLLAGYKRAANILKAEEKKDGKTFISEVSETHLSEPAEKSLFAALAKAKTAITPLLEKEDFAAAMQQMAALRVPVDAFFDGVKVNADDRQVRENRLNLLASLRATLHQVADFSRIEG
jgi:glycyl-tRNA synthetase beta chain